MTWGAVIHMHSNKVKPDFKSSNRVKLYAVVVAQEYNRHPKGPRPLRRSVRTADEHEIELSICVEHVITVTSPNVDVQTQPRSTEARATATNGAQSPQSIKKPS